MESLVNQSVTADTLLSALVKFSNLDNADRNFDISANARINGDKVVSFESGVVNSSQESFKEGMQEGPTCLATFAVSPSSLDLNFYGAEKNAAKNIIDAIYVFMADVRASVTNNPIKA